MYNYEDDNDEYDDDSFYGDMAIWTCATCGLEGHMPIAHYDSLCASHKYFYCLNGHRNRFLDKTSREELESKLLQEYAKNAQLERTLNKIRRGNIFVRFGRWVRGQWYEWFAPLDKKL